MRSFFWKGTPRGQGRPRFSRVNGAYKSSEDKAYERALCMAYWAEHAGKRPMDGPLTIRIKAIFPIPKSKPKQEQELMRQGEIKPTCRPDMDNIQKSVLDALNKVAFPDDKAVTWLIGQKVYGDVPGVYVEIDGVEKL